MEVVSPEQCVAPPSGSAVTIGAFDGVHCGHRFVINQLRQRAEGLGLVPTVVTFDRHPAMVVRPDSAPKLLTDLEQKLELLADCGVERTVVVTFDEARAAESAEDFVNELLIERLGSKLVVVGADFHFGNQRRGNVALLEQLGADSGMDVVGVVLESDAAAEAISSTRIRALVAQGDMTTAAVLLGRPHQVRGEVIRGDGRGATIGFPTANVDVPEFIVQPGVGIYAGRLQRADGSIYAAAISVGRRPTFYDDAAPLIEVFVLDADIDLYGEQVRVDFVAHLRNEKKFDGIDELVAAIGADVEATRRIVGAGRLN